MEMLGFPKGADSWLNMLWHRRFVSIESDREVVLSNSFVFDVTT